MDKLEEDKQRLELKMKETYDELVHEQMTNNEGKDKVKNLQQ